MKVVLVVDDDPDDLEIILDAFKACREKLIAVPTHSSIEALKLLAIMEPPSHIILDCNIPKLSGLELLGLIRADSRLRDVPVTLLSTVVGEKIESVSRALSASLMTKSTDMLELKSLILKM